MIKHIVLLDLPDDHDSDELAAIMAGLNGLCDKIAGFIDFEHGPNRDFEVMSENCAYGFICHFANEKASHTYIVDPDHKALGQRLVKICKGGVDGITVIDLAVAT